MYCQCLLLTTLGGEQREKCKISRERRGEVQGFPAINYSVYWGRTAVAQRSHEKKQRSHYQLPHHPHFHPEAAANAAAKENHDGTGKGGCYTVSVIIPAVVRPDSRPGSRHPQPCEEFYMPQGSLPYKCTPAQDGGECDLSPSEHCWGKGRRRVFPSPGRCAGTTCLPPPRPHPTPRLQRQRLTRTTGDTGSLGFSLISSWKQFPPG